MAVLKPFTCIRPQPSLAARVASGPHNAMTQDEIRKKLQDNPLSYTSIVHPKILYSDRGWGTDRVYKEASNLLENWVADGVMERDLHPSFYVYRLEGQGHRQTGLVGCIPVDDILEGRVYAHEKVREKKLEDLSHHMTVCRAQIGGPILMAYRARKELSSWMKSVEEREPLYHFFSENQVWNTIWKIEEEEECARVEEWVGDIDGFYIADGHHRIMSGVQICKKMRQEHPDYTGQEPWNYVACACFPDDQLQILPYSRLVDGWNGHTRDSLLGKISESFYIEENVEGKMPEKRGEFMVLLENSWYRLQLKEEHRPKSVCSRLDISVLQDFILDPILGITDMKKDERLEFIGGRNQIKSMAEKCKTGEKIGFLVYHTSMDELLAVADAGKTMPPKSTWFEPKLCNGLFIHCFDE
ncbi:MAG: DUF1015 family protein [Clostridiales bacterium]|nr:DUF1015 family protein [Clostridiales bacterium]